MTPRRAALADLDRLTTALRDGTDQLAERLAAVEAVAYRNKKSPRPRQRRGLQHQTTSPLRPGDPMRSTTVPGTWPLTTLRKPPPAEPTPTHEPSSTRTWDGLPFDISALPRLVEPAPIEDTAVTRGC